MLSRSLEIAALKRRAESAEEFYIALAQRQEEALLQAAANIPDIQILHRPQYAWPLGPSFRPIYIISGVFLLSLLVALWSVWMVNRMEKRAKS